MGDERSPMSADAVRVIEIELLKLVRYLETFGRRSDVYVDVDRAGYLMLRTLDRLGTTNVNALAYELHLDSSTVTRQAAGLEFAGLVQRRPDTEDRRSVAVLITAAGSRAMARVEAERRREIAALVGGWTDDERDGLARAMSRLNSALETKAVGRDQLRRRRRRSSPKRPGDT
jgi:DNA-binding MarR family transcriptional regulator